MVGLDQKTIEKLSTPIIRVLKGNKVKRELYVKCYTICNGNREALIRELKKYGDDVNITDWNFVTLYEVKGVDPFDLQNLIGFLRKTLTL